MKSVWREGQLHAKNLFSRKTFDGKMLVKQDEMEDIDDRSKINNFTSVIKQAPGEQRCCLRVSNNGIRCGDMNNNEVPINDHRDY